MSKKLIGLTLALALFVVALPVSAAGLTQTQVSAIISLLQSFGAEQSVVNNVAAALGSDYGIPSPLTCASFSDVSYGNFDNSQGGRVSQLQTWLGIPSSAFGFGTYGRKTQAAWDAKCSGTQQNITLTANPQSGAAPLTVMFTVGNLPDYATRYVIDYGDGATDPVRSEGDSRKDSISHMFTRPGTYTVKVGIFGGESRLLSTGNVVAQTQVTVTDQTANTASDGVSVRVEVPNQLTEIAKAGSGNMFLTRWVTKNAPSNARVCTTFVSENTGRIFNFPADKGCRLVRNGDDFMAAPLVRNAGYDLGPGAYKMHVFIVGPATGGKDGPILAEDYSDYPFILTESNNKTATLDQNSLIVHTEKDYTRVTVTGSASNVELVDIGVKGYSDSSARVVNGRWSATLSDSLPTGTYALQVTDAFSNVVLTTGTLVVKTNMQTRDVRINSFTASPSSVRAGEVVTFAWSSNLTQNDVSQYGGGCSIEGITSNNVALNVTPGFTSGSGQLTYLPPSTATYTLRCSSSAKDGSSIDTERVTVTVN